jgi:putative ABC transport system ATP-binding protein
VTPPRGAAATADRIVFLVDGRLVDEMFDPTVDRAVDHMKHLGA